MTTTAEDTHKQALKTVIEFLTGVLEADNFHKHTVGNPNIAELMEQETELLVSGFNTVATIIFHVEFPVGAQVSPEILEFAKAMDTLARMSYDKMYKLKEANTDG